jgi:methyl-accepting chemotaxis protein
MFHTPEPGMSVLLRLHNPAKFGDHLNRFMDTKVTRTHGIVVGNELGRAGFAVRMIRPVSDAKGGIAGYVEFGEELGQFVHALKLQTGNDYGLILDKKYVDRQFWADSNSMWKRRDNWSDNSGYVVADRTTANDNIFQFQGALGTIPDQGTVLERYSEGKSHFVRGIFPIHDVAGNTVGAMFVVRDISASYIKMQRTQDILLAMTVACFVLGVILLLNLLNRFIFRRLLHITRAATRLVGGDFETEIKISSDDEVGQLERLFEQFRHIFVDLMKQMTAMQEK